MDQIKACRICLITNVKMNDLRCYPMEKYFESISGMSPPSHLDLPPYACYECAAYIKKSFLFWQKSLQGQAALYDLIRTTGKISEDSISSVDRLQYNLCSNMSFSTNHYTSSVVYEDKVIWDIKNEPSNAEEDQDEKVAVSEDFFKTEEVALSPLYLPSSEHFYSEDDEPLSVHKSAKVEVVEVVVDVKKKYVKKRGKKSKPVDESSEVMVKDGKSEEVEVPSDTKSVGTKTKKRGRPRKTANTGGVDDDEDIHLEEYVTIVKLTKEEQIAEITKRQHSSNYQNAPYKCNLCYKGFIDTDAWAHHVSKHRPSPGDVECPVCKFRFKTKRNLQKHSSNHEKKYACKSCPYVSKTTTQAKQHQRWHKGVTYKCQYCDEVSTKWTSYLSHVRIKHPSEFICGVCGYSFVSQLGLTMHKTMMHKQQAENAEGTKEEGPYCEVCDVKFVGEEAFRRHMVTSVKHTQNTDFKNGCRVCGETFPSGEELRVHHRRLHARARPKNYGKKPRAAAWPAPCDHCSETIANARDYWTHFRRVHPDKPYPIQKDYVCDICGKSFRGNAFLVYHKRTHTEERAYKCAQCPKAFFNRTNLQMHEKTHSDHRPYACTVCFKAFKCKGALDRHFRSHTGVKPYECEVCGKAFGQSNSRKLHVRTVHLKEPAPYVSRARLGRARGTLAREPPRDPPARDPAVREPVAHQFVY